MPRTLDPREAYTLIAAGDVDIVDVRGPEEWASGHIPGARLLPLAELRDDPRKGLPRDRVLFVCARGARSLSAAGLAEAIGLKDVSSLDGGTLAWASAGLPIETPPATEVVDDEEPTTRAGDEAGAAGCGLPAPTLDAVIGTNLRTLRTQHELSLDSLARVTGLSRALLGQIENGRASPSVSVVWKIARAFDVPFSALLANAERPATSVMRRSAARRLVSPDGRFSSRALYPLNEETNVEFYELFFAPHSREDAQPHRVGTRENLVIASGRLELEVDGEHYELAKGDAIEFAADVPHSYVNPGADECWVYLMMTYVSRER
jgi:rhodanese-related sulfurtransferase/transcriptional regulator with XRE-family HTH domain